MLFEFDLLLTALIRGQAQALQACLAIAQWDGAGLAAVRRDRGQILGGFAER
jgi:hypothetical protein